MMPVSILGNARNTMRRMVCQRVAPSELTVRVCCAQSVMTFQRVLMMTGRVIIEPVNDAARMGCAKFQKEHEQAESES